MNETRESIGRHGIWRRKPTRRSAIAAAAVVLMGSAAVVAWRWWGVQGLPEGILEGHGRIEAIEVAVSSKVAGRIAELKVREGDAVRAGDTIARLSSQETERRLEQAQSHAGAAEAQLRMRDEETHTQYLEAQARLRAARERLAQTRERMATLEHHLERTRADNLRDRELVEKGFISERQLDRSDNALRQAEGELSEARRLNGAAQAELQAATASASGIERQRPALLESLKQEAAAARATSAELAVARDELEILAPVDGTVITRAAELGELLPAGKPVVVLADLARPYLRVYLTERDVGRIRLNDPARVYVDALPQRSFEALVTEVSKKAEFTPKDIHMPDERATLVFSVKLEMRNVEGLLKPGMPAAAHIRWKSAVPWPPAPRS